MFILRRVYTEILKNKWSYIFILLCLSLMINTIAWSQSCSPSYLNTYNQSSRLGGLFKIGFQGSGLAGLVPKGFIGWREIQGQYQPIELPLGVNQYNYYTINSTSTGCITSSPPGQQYIWTNVGGNLYNLAILYINRWDWRYMW